MIVFGAVEQYTLFRLAVPPVMFPSKKEVLLYETRKR